MDLRRAELRGPWERWEAGTQGVIVDAFEDEAVFEIVGETGAPLDLLSLPWSALIVYERAEQTNLPV